MFESGLEFLRADFHLHTQKDKEFSYSGEPNDFVKSYISALKQANISVGVITNHNKFDKDEYKALKRAASKEKIFILPGVELTVKEGANGIHTLIVFNPDEWLENGNNHIQTFLTAAFATISNPENRKDDTLDIDGFVKMTEELEKYKENLKQLDERAKSKKQIESAFKKAMRERNDILLEQFNAYKLEIQKINESQNELKITIDFKGDRDNFKSQMKTDFRGSGISEIKYQYLCDTFRDYVELIEDWILCDGMKIKEIISSSEYTKLDKKLQDQYADLLKNQVSNNVEIYYHDKLLRHHSIGQRASALILFILMQSDNDIILIDQPEDDLDNKIIYDEVITAIAKKKQDIQFIFATHNANIPVLGDAERIFVVEYQDTTIDISQGNIDLKSTHKQIVDIMEGGEEAFDKRQLIYTSWK